LVSLEPLNGLFLLLTAVEQSVLSDILMANKTKRTTQGHFIEAHILPLIHIFNIFAKHVTLKTRADSSQGFPKVANGSKC